MKILFSVLLLISTTALSALAQASASTGGDQTICGGQSTTGLGGSVGNGATNGVWTSSGTGTFAPDDTTLNATYTPSAADASTGTVTLTLTTTDQPEGVPPGTAQVVVTIPPVLQAPVAWNSDPTNMTGMGLYLCWKAVPGADGYCVDVFDPGLVWVPFPFTAEILNFDVGNATSFFDFDAGPGFPGYYFRVRAYSTSACDAKRHYGPASNFAAAYNSNAPDPTSVSATNLETVYITWDDNNGLNQGGTLDDFNNNSDMASVSRICLANQGITSISFGTNLPALQSVDLSGNLLTNVYCVSVPLGNYGPLTSLNLSNNPYLMSVDCFWINLTELDLTGDTNLQRLNAAGTSLTNIDVTTCTSLTFVDICGDQLASFDTSQNPQLTFLAVADNPLVALDVTSNTELLTLNVGSELITNLDLSNNPKLQVLLLVCPNLTDLRISSTELVGLVLPSCPAGVLPTLTNMPNLMCLGVPQGTPSLDISENPLLFWLNCSGTSLPSLTASNYPLLEILLCAGCGLTNLDSSSNTNLIYLDCSSNSLPSLDVSQNLALHRLYCAGCGLTNLDISSNTSLALLDCSYNSLPINAVNAILANLDTNNGQCFGNVNLSGGSNASPSGGGQNPHVVELSSWHRFWTVTIDP